MLSRHVVLRADASPSIGTGHVMRVLTLASALVARGWRATLVARDLPPLLRQPVTKAGVDVIDLSSDGGTGAELSEFTEAIGDEPITLLVADHYQIEASWFDALRSRATLLMAIDDLADRPMPADLILNQNLGAGRGLYGANLLPGSILLSGPTFALVRPEFAELRRIAQPRDGVVERVFVFISGADPHDVVARVVAALAPIDVHTDVVVGAAYQATARLRAIISQHPAMSLYVNVDDIAKLMARADMAIGAPSSASWERCTLSLPSVLITVAENQIRVADELVKARAAVSAGWHSRVTARSVRKIVSELREDQERVAEMSIAAGKVTDGLGVERVVSQIEQMISERTSGL